MKERGLSCNTKNRINMRRVKEILLVIALLYKKMQIKFFKQQKNRTPELYFDYERVFGSFMSLKKRLFHREMISYKNTMTSK
jgi:hypothetical protein